ncbi:MAG: hypothetical protein MJ252_30205 [archaeon]|nr:hypothetical protein [archaeon]
MTDTLESSELQYIYQQIKNNPSLIKFKDRKPSENNKEEETKNSSKSVVKLEVVESPLMSLGLSLDDISGKSTVDKSDFIMALVEIGSCPSLYVRKFPNPKEKFFWHRILRNNEQTQKIFYNYFQRYQPIPPIKMKELFVSLDNLKNPKLLLQIVQYSKEEINKSPLK